MKYYVVIFDVVDSKKYDDRYVVQRILKESIMYLNCLYSDTLEK